MGTMTGVHPGVERERVKWRRGDRLGPHASSSQQHQHTHLKTLVLTAVQLLFVGRLLGADESGVL